MSSQLSHIDKRTPGNGLKESELRRDAVSIDGRWLEPTGGRGIEVVDCYTEMASLKRQRSPSERSIAR